MKKRIVAGLVVTTCCVASCGRAPSTVALAPAAVGAMKTAAASADARAHAARFAVAIRKSFKGHVAVNGAVVTLMAAKQPAVAYDFTDAPATHLVAIRMDGYETRMDEERLLKAAQDKGIPPIVVAAAVQMALGGAKALAAYYVTHQTNFDKKEATRLTLIGMGDALMAFVPHGQDFKALVPIVVDLIMKVKVTDLKHVAEAAMGQVDRIIEAIRGMFKDGAAEATQVVPLDVVPRGPQGALSSDTPD